MATTLSLLPRAAPKAVRVERGATYWLPHARREAWRTSFATSTREILAEILIAVDRTAREVWVRDDDPPLNDVDIMADLESGVSGPVAVITRGPGVDDVRATLASMAARA